MSSDKDPTQSNGAIFPAQARLVATYKKSVNSAQTLAELSIDLPSDCIGVEIRNEGSAILRFGLGNANANNGGIAQFDAFSFWDTRANLEILKFYTGSATDISFFIYTG